MTDLANTVRDARLAARLTQAEVARRAGITPSYVSRIEAAAWERGGPLPSEPVLRALARVLNCSSTQLVEFRRGERQSVDVSMSGRGWTRYGGTNYAVTVGNDDVNLAAQRLLERNPRRGSVRLTTHLLENCRQGPGLRDARYAEVLAHKLAHDTSSILYCMCVIGLGDMDRLRSMTERLAAGREPNTVHNIRIRCCFAPPSTFEVIVGEQEALIAVPDRRGHPFLRAGLVIDDPDFVGSLKDWFDDFIWEPQGPHIDIPLDRLDEAIEQVRRLLGSRLEPSQLSLASEAAFPTSPNAPPAGGAQ